MSDLLESIKEKYSEEVGWSFSFFEGITFLIFLIATYEALNGACMGIWQTILMKSASSIFSGDESILANARILDYLVSALLTIAAVYSYRKIKNYTYKYLSSLKNIKGYVDRLKQQYSKNDLSNQAMRIYIANEAKEQKNIYMRRLTSINGFGLIFLSIIASSVVGDLFLLMLNWVDFVMLIIGTVGILFIQWQVFTLYTAQVVPRLVLERVARGENVEFGDELQ
jgi:hypothetical protein